MDFDLSPKVQDYQKRLLKFMDEYVYDAEEVAIDQVEASGDEHHIPEIVTTLQEKARGEGLWNLFLPDREYGAGLNNHEYAPLCEIMGRSLIAPRIFNCAAPDTGNMEILAEFGTPEQKEHWLKPLLNAEIRSCFSMTEPEVAGSDPTQIRTRADLMDGEWVINGHKWFTSGAYNSALAIAMVVTNQEGASHNRASQILVPTDAPGFNIVRAVKYMGHSGGGGHCEVRYEDCRVPEANLLGPKHGGFMIAQARLGPGRIHHCMRCIGAAERALEMMCQRANHRFMHGSPLADKGVVQDWIAQSRIEIDQIRLLTMLAAWKMDTVGKENARQEISMIKVVAGNVMMAVVDRAIQTFGAMGTTDDIPLAKVWRNGRSMRLADGPDEVHKMVIARRELRRWKDKLDPCFKHIDYFPDA
jgi:acyl-CoA dehydrogenase